MARKKPIDDEISAHTMTREAARLADSAARLLAAVEELGIHAKPLARFPLDQIERKSLAALTALPDEVRRKVAGRVRRFAAAEIITMLMAVADSLLSAEPERQSALLGAAAKLSYSIHSDLLTPAWRAAARQTKPSGLLYQLKITLLDTRPAIWRRIQTRDCTLDRLHELIQTTMGWSNSHLHHFEIDGQRYGDPQLMEEAFHEMNYRDSTITLLSDVVPKDKLRSRFRYEYDFGDSWDHDVLFEGCPEPRKDQEYPVCLEGERACPPEDVGGVGGYAVFLETITDRDDRERVETLEWVQGWFDPDEFNAATATKSMWKGIRDWRAMEQGRR